jgi:hypothetical protein
MPIDIKFRKTGREIREAVAKRIEQLRSRLDRRNTELEKLMSNKAKLRSYLIRSTQSDFYGHGRGPSQLYSKDDISSEEKEEMLQLCRRIFEIEQEVYRLTLIRTHLRDDQEFELPFEDLVAYGFDSKLSLAD